MADHLASIERQTGKRVHLAEEEVPAVPWPLQHVWNDFMVLTARRSSSGFGMNPLSYAEIEAWARLTSRTLSPMETRLLMRLDDCLVTVTRQKTL
jgi:hypothetical protein